MMSEKEYRIEVDGHVEYIKVKEVEDTSICFEADYSPSFRERMGYKLDGWPRIAKLLLVLPFNIYGTLLRFGSNTAWGIILGFADLLFGKVAIFMILSEIEHAYQKTYNIYEIWERVVDFCDAEWLALAFVPVVFWIIDFFSVLLFNRVWFFGMKRYKDYIPKY